MVVASKGRTPSPLGPVTAHTRKGKEAHTRSSSSFSSTHSHPTQQDKEEVASFASQNLLADRIIKTEMAHLKVLTPVESRLRDLLDPLPTEEGENNILLKFRERERERKRERLHIRTVARAQLSESRYRGCLCLQGRYTGVELNNLAFLF